MLVARGWRDARGPGMSFTWLAASLVSWSRLALAIISAHEALVALVRALRDRA
jgi:hypothetical protein